MEETLYEFLKFAQELSTEIGKWNESEGRRETNYVYEGKEYSEKELIEMWLHGTKKQ